MRSGRRLALWGSLLVSVVLTYGLVFFPFSLFIFQKSSSIPLILSFRFRFPYDIPTGLVTTGSTSAFSICDKCRHDRTIRGMSCSRGLVQRTSATYSFFGLRQPLAIWPCCPQLKQTGNWLIEGWRSEKPKIKDLSSCNSDLSSWRDASADICFAK